jgi:sugar/nucleoside kinase (ribokinase family)
MHEVYAYGIIARSTLCTLEGTFPARAGYAEIDRIAELGQTVGGEAAGGAYALARLGIPTKLDGSWLGADQASRQVIGLLSDAGVDCSRITLTDKAETLRELVVADGDVKTVFGNYIRVLDGDRAWNEPSGDDIQASRMVCLDPFFGEQSQQAAAMCVEAKVPYVTIDVLPETEICRHAAAVIVSQDYLSRFPGAMDRGEAFAAYIAECPGLVVLTDGAAPVVFGYRGSEPEAFPPFDVDVVDTTAAGDAIRAGIIYGLLAGQGTQEVIRTGCAVAAMVCQTMPGFINSPTEVDLRNFLRTRDPA